MANLSINNLHGSIPIDDTIVRPFSIQLHITGRCDQKCGHCYLSGVSRDELPLSDWMSLIDEYYLLLRKYRCMAGFLAITGGDPILSPIFWPLLEYIRKKYGAFFIIVVMGNPYHIDRKTVQQLKDFGVYAYQISIDGMEEKHDALRKKGSFDDSLNALRIIKEGGLHAVVSMTISKYNCDELFALVKLIEMNNLADEIGFDRMIPVGNGSNMKELLFLPDEYRKWLFKVFKWEVLEGKSLFINKREKMWKLMFYQLGLVDPLGPSCSQEKGCYAGTGSISIMPDGTIYPCSKLMVAGGKYPEHSLEYIYKKNKITKELVNSRTTDACKKCEINDYCRGCPAMKYAVEGDINAKEPYCWK